MADAFFNRSFLDPSVKGEFPKELVDILKNEGFMPDYTSEDLDIIKKNTVDLLGVNYYQPRRVKTKEHLPNPDAPFLPDRYFDPYVMPDRENESASRLGDL
nr:family 1 glycosylhydrolase [Bacillus subtilis]